MTIGMRWSGAITDRVSKDSCECDQTCCVHGDSSCPNRSEVVTHTIYGKYLMCSGCALNLTEEYLTEGEEVEGGKGSA